VKSTAHLCDGVGIWPVCVERRRRLVGLGWAVGYLRPFLLVLRVDIEDTQRFIRRCIRALGICPGEWCCAVLAFPYFIYCREEYPYSFGIGETD
jgi:hypothetical protein